MNTNLRQLKPYVDYQNALIASALTLPFLLSTSLVANQKLGLAINKISASDQVKFLFKTADFEKYTSFLAANPIDSLVFFSLPAASLFASSFLIKYYFRTIDPVIHVRGRRFLTDKKAIQSATLAQKDAVRQTGLGCFLSEIPISRQKQLQSFLIMGAQGGGKTVVINSLLKQAIENNRKCVIFDLTKGDFTGWVDCPILSPTDARSVHWFLGFDLLDLGDASTFAKSMIPDGDDPFWSSCAQNILIAIILKLQKENGKNWSWLQLSNLIFNSEIKELKAISDTFYTPARDSITDAESKMSQSIIVTLRSFCSSILRMSLVTSKIHKNYFGFISYLNNENSVTRQIIIHGDKKDSELSSALARAVVNLSTKHISSLQFSESKTRNLQFFLDELPQAGKLADIASLLEIGRSKGVCCVLGFQDISQINQIYSKDEAQKWFALTGVKIFPKVQGSVSQKFVTQEIGDREIEFYNKSVNINKDGRSINASMQRDTVPVLLQSQLETDFGPNRTGVNALVLGVGADALKLHFKFSDYPKIRKSFIAWPAEIQQEIERKVNQFKQETIQIREQSQQEIEVEKSDLLADFDNLNSAQNNQNEAVEKIVEPVFNEVVSLVLGVDSHVVEAVSQVLEVNALTSSSSLSDVQTDIKKQKFKRRDREVEVD